MSGLVILASMFAVLRALAVLLVALLVLLGLPLLLVAVSARVGEPSCVLHPPWARVHRAGGVPARIQAWR